MDITNPWDILGLPDNLRPPQQQRQPIKPLDPQEEDSLLGKVAGGALGGLGYVGSVLEKSTGARGLRGLITGNPREALSVLPLSDTLGITDPAERVSGKQLLGLDKESDLGSEALGLGAEVALDPATWASLGGVNVMKALTPAAKGLGSAINTVGKNLPFGGGHLWNAAGEGLQTAGRYGRALFDPSVMGATSQMGQEAASNAHALIKPLIAEHLQKAAGYGESLRQTGLDPTGQVLRGVLEGTHTAEVHPLITQVAGQMKQDFQNTLTRLQDLGVPVQGLTDVEAGYAPRYQTFLEKGSKGYGRTPRPLLAVDPNVAKREDFLRDVVGGTNGINEMILDPLAYQGNPMERSQYLRKYVSPTLDEGTRIKQSGALADWVQGLDPQYRASIGTSQPLRFFGNHPLADYADYYGKVSRLTGAGEASQDLLARMAMETGGQLGPQESNLLKAMAQSGMTEQGHAGMLNRLNKLRGEQGLAPTDLEGMKNYVVPDQASKEINRYMRGFTTPDAVSGIGQGFDTLTGLTKALQTAPWPGFHVRNLMSGLWQNWIKGGAESKGGLAKGVSDAYKLIKGEVIPDAHLIPGLQHLTPEAATSELRKEMFAWGVGGHMPNIANEGVGPLGGTVNLGTDLESFMGRIPGERPNSLSSAAAQYIPKSGEELLPWNVSSVTGGKDVFAPVRGGRAMGDLVEGVNRGSLYTSLRRQGMDPQQAAENVLAAHFDYTRGGKTDFEAKFLSRLIPFYTYARNNIPFQIQHLMENPGGAAGIAAKAAHDFRQQSGFLPDYLGSGLAIPMGKEDSGTQRFLTRLDLPPEQAFEMFHGGPHGPQNSAMSLLSQMNPILKAPLEWATGKQFFTGRDLGDLYSMTGSPTVDQLAMNSPFSRGLTTLRTLTDPRKLASPEAALAMPLNLATGAKITDVDMEKQRNIAAREFLTQKLQGLPEIGKFETLYPKPGMPLTPEELTLMRLSKTVEKAAADAAKQKKIQVQGP